MRVQCLSVKLATAALDAVFSLVVRALTHVDELVESFLYLGINVLLQEFQEERDCQAVEIDVLDTGR